MCIRDSAIHPYNKKVYVVNNEGHQVMILNPDLTFYDSFGKYGYGNGQFSFPWDVAFDNNGNVYIADSANKRIQVLTAEGQFLRMFGMENLTWPTSISIDCDNVVYVTDDNDHCVSVFTCEGKFLTSFGTEGSGPGQFNELRGITVDKNGVVYVSDSGNSRLQLC